MIYYDLLSIGKYYDTDIEDTVQGRESSEFGCDFSWILIGEYKFRVSATATR